MNSDLSVKCPSGKERKEGKKKKPPYMFRLMAGLVDVSTMGPWLGLVSQNQRSPGM